MKEKKATAIAKRGKGRPSKNIEWRPAEITRDQIMKDKTVLDFMQRMAEEQCTAEQIAATIGCSRETVYHHFSDILHTGKDKGRRRLIAAMWEKALVEKDTKMQIWLSKQHLGYKESHDMPTAPITFNIMIAEVPK